MRSFVLWEMPELHSFKAKVAVNAVTAEAEASARLNFERRRMTRANSVRVHSRFELLFISQRDELVEREVGAYF